MTIEQELLNNTPLPLDIIRYCIEPFLIPDQAHWRKQFDLVIKSMTTKYSIIIKIIAHTHACHIPCAKPNIRFRVFDIRENCYKYDILYYDSLRDNFRHSEYQSFEITPSFGVWHLNFSRCKVIERKEVQEVPRASRFSRFWSWIKGSCSL